MSHRMLINACCIRVQRITEDGIPVGPAIPIDAPAIITLDDHSSPELTTVEIRESWRELTFGDFEAFDD